MAIDREATLKNAEKFLRVGRLEAAIAEYARVVDDQPKDWNTTNALGDLYIRAGQADKAVPLYRRIAEHLFAEGFYPKAGALFKKVLKISADDEQARMRLAEISARQGLMADARSYYTTIETRRRRTGDDAGADEIVVRLGTLDPEDLDAALAAARAAERGGNAAGAAERYRALYDAFTEQGREADASNALRATLRCGPDRKDSGLLLPLARLELTEGRHEAARGRLTQLIASGPGGRELVTELAWQLTATHPEAAGVCVDAAAEALVDAAEFAQAAALLQEFTTRVPGKVPTLLRLVEVCVDGGLEGAMYEAQAQLADAYLAEDRPSEARMIAEDLVARNPGEPAHLQRLRRALQMLDVVDVEAAIAERVSASTSERLDDLEEVSSAVPCEVEGSDRGQTGVRPRSDPGLTPPAPVEIDLTQALSELEGQSVVPHVPPRAPQELDQVFADLRADAGQPESDDESDEYLELGMTYLEMDLPQEAITPLEMAARSPRHRFVASSLLAQVYRDTSDLGRAIEWLERAAEAPAPGPDEARTLLYDLADVLETLGESARALAVFLELQADAPDYRDVSDRVARLSRVETEG